MLVSPSVHRLVTAVGYYGLSLSLTSLAGDKYLTLFIGGCVELPAYCAAVFILNRSGTRRRRRPVAVGVWHELSLQLISFTTI